MKLIFLGTGTSQGVPVIGCTCEVCSSKDAKDKRLRASVIFIKDDFHLLIDLSPDLRQQFLDNALIRIDAICMTHEHNDHVGGLDDIRPINFRWRRSIPLYGQRRVITSLRQRFHYAFSDTYSARPRIDTIEISAGQRLQIGPFEVVPLSVRHGELDILGFKVDDVAYLTDVKSIPPVTHKALESCKTLILSALHKTSHVSHMNLTEALDLTRSINPSVTYLTHMSHYMGFHQDVSKELPDNVFLAHDNMKLEF